jgi:hypothetical protein
MDASSVLKASRRLLTMMRRPAIAPSLVKAGARVVTVGAVVVGAGGGGWAAGEGGLPWRSWIASQAAVAARAAPRATPSRVRGFGLVIGFLLL